MNILLYSRCKQKIKCKVAKKWLILLKPFLTNILKNIIRQLFDGESRQVIKITVPYFTLPLRREGSAKRLYMVKQHLHISCVKSLCYLVFKHCTQYSMNTVHINHYFIVHKSRVYITQTRKSLSVVSFLNVCASKSFHF